MGVVFVGVAYQMEGEPSNTGAAGPDAVSALAVGPAGSRAVGPGWRPNQLFFIPSPRGEGGGLKQGPKWCEALVSDMPPTSGRDSR